LAGAAAILLVATGPKLDRLIPLYAIGVFTSFTMSQAGMAKHHVTRKEPGWRRGLFVNGFGAFLSAVVDIIILITKFTAGAWVVVLFVPIMVYALTRLNKQYEAEAEELEKDAPRAAEAPIKRRHEVYVLIENLDVAAARAIQYARTLVPDELRAVHFAIDDQHANELSEAWRRLGLSRLPLELIDVPDRRITRAAVELCAQALADGDTEVSLLLPRRVYRRAWHRLLHDRTAESIAAAVAGLPHANVTFVPYHLGDVQQHQAVVEEAKKHAVKGLVGRKAGGPAPPEAPIVAAGEVPEGVMPIASVTYRQRARIAGRVKAMRVQPWSGVATLECTVVDESGGIIIVFLGRKQVAGIATGVRLVAAGMVGDHGGRLAMLNPDYRILPEPHTGVTPPPTTGH
jgi:hypothetical protein